MRNALSLLLFASVLVSGCATVLSGTDDDVVIRSEPTAQAQIDGDLYQTPTEVGLDRGDVHAVRFKKEGYEEHPVTLDRGLNWGGLLSNILIGGGAGVWVSGSEQGAYATGATFSLVGIGLDFLTGGAYRVTPDDLNVQLEKKPPERIAASPARRNPSPPSRPRRTSPS